MTTSPNLFNLPTHEAPRDQAGRFIKIPMCTYDNIKNHILSGLEINQSMGHKLYYTHDTRKYISMLKQEGIRIADRWHTQAGYRFKVWKLSK